VTDIWFPPGFVRSLATIAGDVDAVHPQAPSGEGQRNASRADGELEHGTVTGQLREERDRRRRVGTIVQYVVDLGRVLTEAP